MRRLDEQRGQDVRGRAGASEQLDVGDAWARAREGGVHGAVVPQAEPVEGSPVTRAARYGPNASHCSLPSGTGCEMTMSASPTPASV